MKKNRIFNALVLAASLILLNTSCEVGLGASVDVDAPTLSITYPEQGSVIRENFIIYGECGDDKGISHINVTVNHMNGEKATVIKTFKATLDETQTTWQANINDWLGEGKGYNGWELADGNYVIDVNAIDFSGRDSGIASLSVDIDNTVPIFIIKSPTSKKITSPTSYGTSFKITGTMTDDHTVSKMIIKVYDKTANFDDPENPPVPLETIYESNIDTTTEVVVANRNREGDLRNRYNKFYEGTTEGENCPLWCTVEMEDNAKIYRNPGEAENTSRGNVTNRFYIVDEVNSTWASSDKDMDPGKVKKIVNKTATGISSSLADEVMKLYNENAVTQAAFSINSDSNPTYEIRNFGNSIDGSITKAAAANASVSFSLSPGRNGDNVCPTSVKVFLWGPFDNPATQEQIDKMYNSDLNVIEAYAKTPELNGKVEVIAYMGSGEYVLNGKTYKYYKEDGTIDTAGAGGSVPNFDREINLADTITTGKIYYISANALDLADANANPAYKVFAFKGYSSGQAPTIKFEDHPTYTAYANTVEDDAIKGNATGLITYAGSALYADGIEDFSQIKYRFTSKKEDNTDGPYQVDVAIPDSNIIKDSVNKKIYWRFTFDPSTVPADVIYDYSFIVTAYSLSEQNTPITRKLTIDTKQPEVLITSINPVVIDESDSSKKYLNGTLNVEAKVTDKNLKEAWFEVYGGSPEDKVYTSGKFGEDSYSVSAEIDTTAGAFDGCDEKPLRIEFHAIDKAGNKNVYTSTTLNGNNSYILSQKSDKPVVKPNFTYDTDTTHTTAAALATNAWYGKGAKLNFNVSDDDGLTSVKVNGTSQTINANTTNASINYSLPNTDQILQITLVAQDNTYTLGATPAIQANRETTWGPYVIGIDTNAPTISDTNAFTTNYATQKFKVSGNVDDANGIASIEVKATKVGAAQAAKTYSIGSGVTYDKPNGKWEVEVKTKKEDSTNGLSDGKYTFTTTAKDYAGNETTVESIWTVDIVKPVIDTTSSPAVTKVTSTPNAAGWHKKDKIDIQVKATDGTSGVADVLYSLDGSSWTSLTPPASGSDIWTGSVNCAQGTNEIKLKALDEAGLYSDEKTLTAKVDTTAPENVTLYSVAGDTTFSGTKMVNGQASLKFVVTATDATSGIASVQVSSIGATSKNIGPGTKNGNNYEIEIPVAQFASGIVKVTATDNAGNTSIPVELFTLDSDTTDPVIEIKTIDPVVTRSGTSYLNGKFTITGRITEANLVKRGYKVYSNEIEVTALANEEETSEPGFTWEINTTATGVIDNKSFNVEIYAIDKAGNKGTAEIKAKNNNVLYTVLQSTDKPEISPNNYEVFKASEVTDGKYEPKVKSWLSGGDKLLFSVKDDDALGRINVVTKNKDGSSIVTAAANQSFTANSLTANISYDLPSTSGVYQVTILVEDSTYNEAGITQEIQNNRTVTSGPFLVGIDNDLPSITETHSEGTNYVNNKTLTLGGTASDDNGIKDIEVKIEKEGGSTTVYKLSDTNSKVTFTSDAWSCAPTLDSDGKYTITTTVTDYAGKTNYAVSSYVVDCVKPTVTPSIKTTATNGWYKTTNIEMEATASDATSGVVSVQYSLDDGTNWSDFKNETTKWTATVKCAQGENTIKVQATDASGLKSDITSSTTFTAKVDTTSPETLNLVSVAGDATFSGIKMVDGKSDLTFVVEAADSGTGVASVVLSTIGGVTKNISAGTPAGNKYTIKIPKANLSSGAVNVKVTDKAGNAPTEKALFNITVDNTPPVVKVTSVTPVVTDGAAKLVNGKLKVNATITDTYLKEVSYKIYKNDTAVTNYSYSEPKNAIEIEIDTTTYADDDKINVEISAKDQAGNTASAKASDVNGNAQVIQFKVNQESDRPVVVPNNFEYVNTSTTNNPALVKTWFGKNSKLLATVTDDDSLKSVTIGGIEQVTTGTTPSTVNIKEDLGSTDGIFAFTIVAEDSTYDEAGISNTIKDYRKKTYGPFIVGVDTANPTVTDTYSSGTNYYVKDTKDTLTGTADDANGIKEIEVKVTKAGDSTATKTYKKSASEISYNSSTKVWSVKIAENALADGNYTVETTVTDYAGKTATATSSWVVDTNAPTVSLTLPTTSKTYNSNKAYTTSTIAIEATATDVVNGVAGSGVSTVEYSIDNSNWVPLRQDSVNKTKWTASITFTTQGVQNIYVRATDAAGLTGEITNKKQTIFIDSVNPEECSLVSVDGKAETKKLANGKSDITVIVKAKDNGSGIDGVKITKIGNTDVEISSTSNSGDNYTITIPKDTAATPSVKTIEDGQVVVTITDNLGNSTTATLFTLTRDEAAPSLTINELADAEDEGSSDKTVDLNGSVTISGTAADVKELSTVKLYYAVGDTKPAIQAGWTELTNAGSIYAWKAILDTTSLTDNKKLYFKAVAEDSAGNITEKEYSDEYSGYQLKINQDSDRPKIILSNLALTADSDGKFWHTASTLQGRVEDDDGNVKSIKISKDGTTYSSNLYSKGTWKYTDLGTDGAKTLYFKVEDAKGKEFVSAATGRKGPKVIDSAENKSLGFFGGTETEVLSFTLDTQIPDVTSVAGYTSNTTTCDTTKFTTEVSALDTVGGTNKYLYIKVASSDTNGIKAVTLKLDDKTAATASDTNTDFVIDTNTTADKTTYIARFDLSKLTLTTGKTIETKTLSVTVEDKAGKKYEDTINVTLDNVNPTIEFDTAQDSTLYGSVANTLTGRTKDSSNISNLWYAVVKTNTAPTDASKWTKVGWTEPAEDQIAKDNWSIAFDGESPTKTEFHTQSLNTLYGTYAETATNLSMYLFMKAEDSLGNVGISNGLHLNVIPDADRPTVTMTYPTGDKAVGGNIRVTGTAEISQDSVGAVYMQIDPTYSGNADGSSFANDWVTELQDLIDAKKVTGYKIVDTGLASPYNKAILAKGTAGWSQIINADHEFETDSSGNRVSGKIAIKVFAVSRMNKKISTPIVTVVDIDPNSPLFGDLAVDGHTGMSVVKYQSGSSGTITARQKYTDDMSLKGQWYFRGSISDDSGIKNATVKVTKGLVVEETTLVEAGVIKKADWVSKHSDAIKDSVDVGDNFTLNIPVGSDDADLFGTISYEIWIQDNSEEGKESETTKVYKVNYDNKAPVFEVTTANKDVIYNSNGTYTLAGTFKEESNANGNQSGFERIVAYVTNKRGPSDTTLLVDPMISKGSDFISNREAVSGLSQADGLYWRTVTINKVENGVMTVSKINGVDVNAANPVTPKVRAGGLCKVDGVIYRINTASGTSVTLNDISVNSSATTVYIAAGALVIDNTVTESGNNTTVYDATKTTVHTNGDGDQMIERVSTSGTTSEWSFSIDSTQIRDGEVKVHFVAFDAAGNISTDSYTAQVKNNAPRFAGVKFGSDFNLDNNITGNEWNTRFADMYVQVQQTYAPGERANGKQANGTIVDNITIDEKYRLPIKNIFKVIPQIVGGNDGLTWSMSYKDGEGTEKTTTATDYNVTNSVDVIRNYGTDSEAANYTTANDSTYTISYSKAALNALNSNKGMKGGEQTLTFTISDKTEGGALNATINLPVNVMVTDGTAPEASWKPLYWKSKSDNSLYNNSQSNGHIELGADWTASEITGFTDVSDDTDDKVSGIITMEGVVKDNVRVDTIVVNVDDTDYTFSRDDESELGWTAGTDDANLLVLREKDEAKNITALTYDNYFTSTNNQDWYFELISDVYDENPLNGTNANPDYGKNIVTYKFHWNTAKMLASSKKAKANVQVKVNGSDISSTNTCSDVVYQLDVVPYIARVFTELADLQKTEAKWSNTSRTSNGAYPVRYTTSGTANGETVSFYGFNLSGATGTSPGTKKSYVTAPYDCVQMTVSSSLSSGEFALEVNGINTINNINNNDAKGSATVALTDSNCGTYGYNRQPNSASNYKLTDDVKFDVWEINSAAGSPVQGRLEQPVMSINQVTGWIGFGFADGPATFSMGGSNFANGRSWSYYQWQKSFDAFTSVAFAYDALGNSYGTAAGGDISLSTLDRFVMCSSRASSPTLALDNTYNGANSIRLEKIGQTNMNSTDKQRFKSPSITTAVHGSTINQYVAYYDSINNEIRVRWGTGTNEDFAEDTDVSENGASSYSTNKKSLIAYGVSTNANRTTYTTSGSEDASPGEYLSIAVISAEGSTAENSTADDKLACVYYNQLTKTLWYTYNSSPTAARASGATNRGSWTTPIRVFAANSTMAAAGQYCKMVADKNGGLHIAAYDPENQDLCYAYLANPAATSVKTSSFKTAVVDSKDVVGSNLSIDVGLKLVGGSYVPVPSIGYYSTENVKPMYAYLYDTSKLSSTTAGALDGAKDERYTGVWECSLVPTTEVPDLQSKLFNMINVGLWKTAYNDSTKAGVIKTTGIPTSVTQKDSNGVAIKNDQGTITGYQTYNKGLIWGNGTGNAVLGYAVKHGGGSNNIETAQKR